MSRRKTQLPLFSFVFIFAALAAGFLLSKPTARLGGNISSADVAVHFIDVGQGDAELILLPGGKTLLIDAGDNGQEGRLLSHLRSAGVSQIDYLVGTHPHADHIGGMQEVVDAFPIGKIFMPKVTHTSKTYLDLLKSIDGKGLSIETAHQGKLLFDENGVRAEFLAPCQDSYDELNNYSAVLRLTYQNVSFLFTGDAEVLSENEMLSAGVHVQATVLKIGHHGSSTSTNPKFLKAVLPVYAVISCGKGNSYGHPHTQTLKNLKKSGVQVFRTDEMGTIIMETDGKNVNIKKNGDKNVHYD